MPKPETFYEVMRRQGISRRSFLKFCSLTTAALGLSPALVEGHPRNLKVTLPSDVRIAEMYLATAQPELL